MAKLALTDVTNITGAEATAIAAINANWDAIIAAIENTVSLDGTTPNSLTADLDVNNQALLNVGTINGVSADFIVDAGESSVQAAAAAASATAAAASETAAETAADRAEAATVEHFVMAGSDSLTPITVATGVTTFRTPYAFTVTEVRASLTTAQTSGNIVTVDINEGGTSILATKITIDNGEKTSTTAATQPVLSDVTLADDAEITVDIDQVGDGTAIGLKIMIIGNRA